MKYICLGYYDEKKWETMSESERNAMMDECFTYDDVLRKSGSDRDHARSRAGLDARARVAPDRLANHL